MANRPQQLDLPAPRTYTRTDFAALRAYVQRIPPATIGRLYLDPDAPHAASSGHIERYLRQMRDDLVQLALLHGSSVLAGHLKQSIRKHGSAQLSAVSLRMVEQVSKLAAAAPLTRLDYGSGHWSRSGWQARALRPSPGSSRTATTVAAAGGDRCRVSVCCARVRLLPGCGGMPARWA